MSSWTLKKSPSSPSDMVLPIEGLSSPFRDIPVNSLSSPYHVIDISPSPPPPALLNSLGQFGQSHEMPESIGTFADSTKPAPKALEKIETFPGSHMPSAPRISLGLGLRIDTGVGLGLGLGIDTGAGLGLGLGMKTGQGLGLGIDTGDGRLARFAGSSGSVMTNRLEQGKPPSIGDQTHLPRQKKRPHALSRSTRSRRSVTEERGYLGEDEDDDVGSLVSTSYRSIHMARKPANNTHYSALDTKQYQRTIRETVRGAYLVGRERSKASLSTLNPLSKGPKRLALEQIKRTRVDSPLSALVNPWEVYSPHSSTLGDVGGKVVLKSEIERVIEPKSKSMRRFLALRGRTELNSPDAALPVDISDLSPRIVDTIAPTSHYSSIASSPTPTMTLSMVSNLAATSMPVLMAQDSPLLLSASPRLEGHSPIMANTPGSFSPSLMDTSVFPEPTIHAHGQNPGGINSTTGVIVFTMLGGSLGILGILFVVFKIFLKRYGGSCSGAVSWKRKPRGTAYDEFIEEEKRWWVQETKLGKKELRESTCTSEEFHKDLGPGIMTAGAKAVSIARGISSAPLVPSISNKTTGMIGMKSARIGLPPNLSSDSLSISSESSADNSIVSYQEKAKSVKLTNDSAPSQHFTPELCKSNQPPVSPGRARSESKSSILSKASKKSISSISSFFRRGRSSQPNDSKFKLGVGVGSEDFSQVNEKGHLEGQAGVATNPVSSNGITNPVERNFTLADGGVKTGSPITDVEANPEPFTTSCEGVRDSARVSWIAPEILITDHPSELIPPSPPPPPPPSSRPISVGTTFTRFSTTSYLSERTVLHRNLLRNSASAGHSSSPPARRGATIPGSRYESSIIDPEIIASLKRAGQPSRNSWNSFGDESEYEDISESPQASCPSGPPRITTLSSLLSTRATRAPSRGSTQSSGFQSKIQTTSRFVPPQRSSLSSIASSKTIRELAAVTEDLRALIDLDAESDGSWHSPTQFHRSVPDRRPGDASARPVPPMRPPKSVNRYNRGKGTSLEYESTSTPSSPINPHMHFPRSSVSSETSCNSDWSLEIIQPPSKLYNRHGSPLGVIEMNPPPKIRRSNSGTSTTTVTSGESNSSLNEVASVHTAQTIKGASVEFVLRSPPQVTSSRRSQPMTAIVEEIEE